MIATRLAAKHLPFVVVVGIAATARAEPHLALRDGYLCSQCHTNRTGGGKRNAFGAVYSQTTMPIWKKWGDAGFLSPKLGDYLSLGADLRGQHLTVFAAESRYQGERLAAPSSNTFRIVEANLYAELALIKNHLSLYIDEEFAPESASSREAFLLLYNLPLGGYVKAGRFLLPYGLRLPDDTIFVREVTGFNYANQDLGAEVGIEPGPFFASIAMTNGTLGGSDNNLMKQLTATAGVWIRHFRLAFNYSWNNGTTAEGGTTRRLVGAYAGAGFGRLALMVEADLIRDWRGPPVGGMSPAAAERWQWALYGEADLLIRRGINLKVAYDFHDPDVNVAEDHRDRFTFALDTTVLPFLRVGVFYYWRRDIPQKITNNQSWLILQVHGFL